MHHALISSSGMDDQVLVAHWSSMSILTREKVLSMKISRYTLEYPVQGGRLLYSTVTGAIVYIAHDSRDNSRVDLSRLKKSTIDALIRTRMVFESDEIEQTFVETAYEHFMEHVNEVLYMTIEITDSCNFTCDYCYQEKHSARRTINEEVIDKFVHLLRSSRLDGVRSLNVNIIGGEPFLFPQKVAYVWNKLSEFAAERNYPISAKINTNGMLLDRQMLSCFHDAEVVFPLGAPIDYDTIIREHTMRSRNLRDLLKQKITELAPIFNANSKLSIIFRYNANHQNTEYFKNYIEELSDLGISTFKVDVVNTNNNIHGCFHNRLTDNDFWNWYLQDVLPVLLQNNLGEPIKFRNRLSRCKARRRYSFKLFADGKIGLCNGIPYSSALPCIHDYSNLEMVNDSVREVKSFDYMSTPRCRKCNKIFVCGGPAICHDDTCCMLDSKIETYVKRKFELRNIRSRGVL